MITLTILKEQVVLKQINETVKVSIIEEPAIVEVQNVVLIERVVRQLDEHWSGFLDCGIFQP